MCSSDLVLVDHRGQDAGAVVTSELLRRHLGRGSVFTLLDRSEVREELLPALLEKAQGIAGARVPSLVAQACMEMRAQLGHEITRLRELRRVNHSVRAEEIDMLVRQQGALEQHLAGARLRLDSIRLIQRGGDSYHHG